MTTTEESIEDKVADFIKQKRMALGMTQREFAVHIFNDPKKHGWICRIENQKRGITLATASKILKALSADIDIIEF